MHTGKQKQKQMNASYQASLVNRHIRRFTGYWYLRLELVDTRTPQFPKTRSGRKSQTQWLMIWRRPQRVYRLNKPLKYSAWQYSSILPQLTNWLVDLLTISAQCWAYSDSCRLLVMRGGGGVTYAGSGDFGSNNFRNFRTDFLGSASLDNIEQQIYQMKLHRA